MVREEGFDGALNKFKKIDNNMVKLAIDIALLPPDEIIDLIIEINQKAVNEGTAPIELNKDQRIPHLTLLMGVLDSKDLNKVTEILREISNQFTKMTLNINAVKDECFEIENIEELQTLHEKLVEKIDPLLTHNASRDMYLEKEGYPFVRDFNHWVNEFINKYSHQNFWPHITIHSPDKNPTKLPIKFTISRLVLCQLGAQNTCRKILFETNLH